MPICELTNQSFEVSEMEKTLLLKMGLSLPKFSPKVRMAMRLAFRNERNLYMRKCDFSGEKIMSIYSQDHPFPVYKYEYWISDDWTPPALDYNFNKSFFDQYKELSSKTPRVNLFAPYNENCDYCNAAEKNKNCYMHILSDRCEDCYYTHNIYGCRDCLDCVSLHDSELCYECMDCRKCYRCRMCFLCDNSSDCNFCFDCRGCQNCFMCSGLCNQQYCINNKPLSKEEYEEKMRDIHFGSYAMFSTLRTKFIDCIVRKNNYVRMINTENSDGNFLINTKNCHQCYDVEDAEDCMYYRIGTSGCRDIIDSHSIVDGSQLIYGNVSTTRSYNCHNVIGCWDTKDSFYSEFLQGCADCIGCISLKRRHHYILNKQYSEEEYNKIKTHIIHEMGDYYGNPFPFSLAPFFYLDSAFRDYDSFTKEEVETIGWRWGEEKTPGASECENVSRLPDDIGDSASAIDHVFLCEKSGKPFKIIPQEIRLLKKINAPLPRFHHQQRFEERVLFRKG